MIVVVGVWIGKVDWVGVVPFFLERFAVCGWEDFLESVALARQDGLLQF